MLVGALVQYMASIGVPAASNNATQPSALAKIKFAPGLFWQ
jgi:hypothetical protein